MKCPKCKSTDLLTYPSEEVECQSCGFSFHPTEYEPEPDTGVLEKLSKSLTWGGDTYWCPLSKDQFVHFTTESRAKQVLASGKLLKNPPYQQFGGDAVYAVSTIFGKALPGTQTTHTKATREDPLVAVIFKTRTVPERAYIEEVLWDRDVVLQGAKIVSASRGFSMIKASPVKIGDQDMVVYDPKHKTAARVARRFMVAEVVQINGPWVDKMRKDFLTLMKNVPRVKDYKTAHRLREAFTIYNNRFHELLFKRFLNKGLKYDPAISEHAKSVINHKLRKPGWDLHLELSLPIGFIDDYWTEDQRFYQYQTDVKPWEKRVRRKAQIFWKAVREAIDFYEDREFNDPDKVPTLNVKVPSSNKVVIEGFQLILQGIEGEYEDDEQRNREVLDTLRAGLKIYRKNASQRMPVLLKKQLPVIVEFETTLDKGGEYNGNGTITFYASSLISKTPEWASHVMAHEMGHHMWRLISGGARKFWDAAISGDYGDLDVQKLVDNWPGDAWAFQFSEVIGQTDPILALQVEAVSQDRWGRAGPQTKEDFQKLLDEGQKTLKAPKTPISGYANKNPQEAFCEAIGLWVTYGPRAVHEKVRGWLNTVLPGEIKAASNGKDRR